MRLYNSNRKQQAKAVKFIQDLFGDMITDFKFVSGLAKRIGTKQNLSFEPVREKDKTFTTQVFTVVGWSKRTQSAVWTTDNSVTRSEY